MLGDGLLGAGLLGAGLLGAGPAAGTVDATAAGISVTLVSVFVAGMSSGLSLWDAIGRPFSKGRRIGVGRVRELGGGKQPMALDGARIARL